MTPVLFMGLAWLAYCIDGRLALWPQLRHSKTLVAGQTGLEMYQVPFEDV